MLTILLHNEDDQDTLRLLPLKIQGIVEDVVHNVDKLCQEHAHIQRIDKNQQGEYKIYFKSCAKGGHTGTSRVIEVLNFIYQFDPKRPHEDFASMGDRGFSIQCCMESHNLNKQYKAEAMKC